MIDIAPDAELEDEGNALEERVTACDVVDVVRKYANQISPSDNSNAPDDEYDELEDDDSDADEPSEEDAEGELEELVNSFSASSKSPSRSDATGCLSRASSGAASPAQSSLQASGVDMDVIDIEPRYSNYASPGDTSACAASPAQALPRDVICGQNPNDRSPSDRTASAAPSPQPAAPPKPAPDRVMHKIHITPSASPLPPRETDAQRAADLIYRSVIKKYGNP
jgi:hypothetical protein